jgi:sugar phosphate isomerase/epimerase
MPRFSLSSLLYIVDDDGFNGNHIEALKKVKQCGFDETELLAEGPLWDSGHAPAIEIFKQTLKEIDLYPRSIHAPYTTVNLESPDHDIREKSIDKVQSAIRFLAELGGEVVVVHPTGPVDKNSRPYDASSYGDLINYLGESVYRLSETAIESGVQIALENLHPNPDTGWIVRPLESMQELRSFIHMFDSKHVGICMDVGHTRLSALDVADQVRIAGDRLFALHIQDGDGPIDSHRPPGQGVIDFDSFGNALSDINFDGAWTMEVKSTYTSSTEEEVGTQTSGVAEIWMNRGVSNI